MTGLAPGVLFKTSGFNRTSTPVGPGATPDDIHDHYAKEEHVGGTWPAESPVARVYDVRNTTSRMVLLNNKSARNHLRGQVSDTSSCSGSSTKEKTYVAPDPGRHYASPVPDSGRHTACVKSETAYFDPKPSTPISGSWYNSRTRPPITFRNGSAVNEKHHYCCQISSDPAYESLAYKRGHQNRARPKTLPNSFRDSFTLEHPELTKGQRRYLADTAHVYSVLKMKQLVQTRYEELLYKQKVLEAARDRGFFSQADYEKYLHYITGPKKRLFGGYSTPGVRSRPQTADPRLQSGQNTPSHEGSDTGEHRPKTSAGMRSGSLTPSKPTTPRGQRSTRRVPIKNNVTPITAPTAVTPPPDDEKKQSSLKSKNNQNTSDGNKPNAENVTERDKVSDEGHNRDDDSDNEHKDVDKLEY